MLALFEKYGRPVARFIVKCNKWDWLIMLPFILLSLKVRLQYFFFLRSPGQSFPKAADSEWYLRYAHALLAGKPIGGHMDDILYMGYNFLLALLLAIGKQPVAVLFLQSVTAGLAVILVYQIARMLFNRTTAIIASYLYCYYTWPITLWSVYILSDSFFITLLLLCVFFLIKALDSGRRTFQILFVVTACYVLIFRPTGILIIGCVVIYLLINANRKRLVEWLHRYRWVLGGAAATALLALVYGWATGRLDPFMESLRFNAKMVLYNIYAKGWIYDRATPADHSYKPDYEIDVMDSLIVSFLVNNWNDIAVLYAKRTAAFLGPWVWRTDLTTLHGMVQFAKNMLPTGLFLLGVVAAVRNGLFRKASILLWIVIAVFLFCILLFIDGMYRYKAPSTPFILIMAAYGIERIVHGVLQLARAGLALWVQFRKRNDASYSA